jgi:hypothetical protein
VQSLVFSLSLNFWFQFLEQPQYLTEEFLLEHRKMEDSLFVLGFIVPSWIKNNTTVFTKLKKCDECHRAAKDGGQRDH